MSSKNPLVVQICLEYMREWCIVFLSEYEGLLFRKQRGGEIIVFWVRGKGLGRRMKLAPN